uniref:Protein takeout n=1 Tax=Lygus hesperus TaxID=30085 RepID=A0A0A9XR41_LYGHE
MMRTLAVLMLAGVAAAKLKPLSSYFDVCSRNQNDKMLSRCVKDSVIKARDQLIKGIPELKLSSSDPLLIKKMEMKEKSGRLKFDQTLTDLKIYGLSNFILNDMSWNLEGLNFNATTTVPKMRMEGSYTIDGQLLIMPIKGSGHISQNLTDVKSVHSVKYGKVQINNKTHLTVRSYKLTVEPKNVRTHLSNLFNGDRQLGDATNAFLNENWYEAFNTYRSLPEKAFSEFFRNQVEQVYKRYTFDELFPE